MSKASQINAIAAPMQLAAEIDDAIRVTARHDAREAHTAEPNAGKAIEIPPTPTNPKDRER